jgi:hypothetical protein
MTLPDCAKPKAAYHSRAMFHLTRRERLLIACLFLAFLTGLTVKHYREAGGTGTIPSPQKRDAKR